MIFISSFVNQKYPFLEKLAPNFQICYKVLFKLFNLIVVSFCFGKLVKIPENASAQQIVLQFFIVVG